MKIGFDAKRFFTNGTGLGNYARTLTADLQHFFPENSYTLFAAEQNFLPQAKGLLTRQPGLQTELFSPAIKSLWRSFSMVKDLEKFGPDIFHGLSNELPFGMDTVKTAVTIHDLIFKKFPGTYGLAERMVYDVKFRYACKNADALIAISECTKRDIIELYGISPERVEVIYQACERVFYDSYRQEEVDQFRLAYRLPQQFLLYVGSIQERKNLRLLIDAYGAGFSGMPVVIVGKGGHYWRECQRRIMQLNLPNTFFHLQEKLSSRDLALLYRAAHAFVYPSFYEGFGLPVAEALLSGTPVITADTSSLREAGGPNSFYVNPKEVDDMVEALQQVCGDEVLRAGMRGRGHAYALQMFNPKRQSARMIDCYKRAIES